MHDVSCSKPVCFACHVNVDQRFDLRGRQEDPLTYIDSNFVMHPNSFKGARTFNGFYETKLEWNDASEQWDVVSMFTGLSKGFMPDKNPLGMKSWNISGTMTRFKLSQCGNGYFSCHIDGSCVPLSQRCDGAFNCKDSSDEKSCSIIRLAENYQSFKPPDNFKESDKPLQVKAEVVLVAITGIDELTMAFNGMVRVTLDWFDPRLEYKNLKPTLLNNILSKEEYAMIWVPEVVFSNALELESVSVPENDIYAIKLQGNGVFNSLNEIDENLIFSGSDNPLTMTRLYQVVLSCNFELSM